MPEERFGICVRCGGNLTSDHNCATEYIVENGKVLEVIDPFAKKPTDWKEHFYEVARGLREWRAENSKLHEEIARLKNRLTCDQIGCGCEVCGEVIEDLKEQLDSIKSNVPEPPHTKIEQPKLPERESNAIHRWFRHQQGVENTEHKIATLEAELKGAKENLKERKELLKLAKIIE